MLDRLLPTAAVPHVMDLPVMPPVRPMLAKAAKEMPGGEYLYEPKWDGFRCLVFRDGDELELASPQREAAHPLLPRAVGADHRAAPGTLRPRR